MSAKSPMSAKSMMPANGSYGSPGIREPRPALPPLPLRAGIKATSTVDSDAKKGAVEDDAPRQDGVKDISNVSQGGQLGHRDKPVGFEDTDSDFPDPESSGEHTGQK
jgi:hypothetical protein